MSIQVTCPNCGVFNDVSDSTCWKCKRPISNEEKKAAIASAKEASEKQRLYDDLPQNEKDALAIGEARRSGDWSQVSDDVFKRVCKGIILTTSFQLAAHEIESEVSIITAEVAYGMNLFRDLFAGLRDIVGGRSGSVQKVLRDSRNTVLLELKKEALMLGADAVIAVDLDYQELSGGDKNGMILLIASGTAVRIKR